MFNPYLQNQGLAEVGKGNFTAMEFTMLYLLNNDVQLNDGDTIQRHNAYFMEKLNLSLSQVQRIMKSLSEKGYITIKRVGTKRNRKANIIRLADASSINRMNDRMNDTPQITCKKTNNTKNSHSITSPCSTSTCGENNQTNTEEKMNDTAENMTEKSDAMTSNESAKNETIEKVRLTSDELRKRNEYISSIYRKLDTSLNFLNSLRDCKMYDETFDEVYRTFQDAEAHEDWFTDGQWKKLEIFHRRFLGITEYKDRYFNGTRTNADADAVTVSMEEETNLNAETDENGDSLPQCNDTPAPRRQTRKCEHVSKEQAIKWVWTTLGKYDSLEEWENAMTKRFNKAYGDWDYGKDANACRFWNIINKEASDYYWSLSEAQAKKKMEMDAAFDEFIKEVSNDEAPWEEAKATKPELNDEEWHEKYGHLLKH